jgi:hypothetical protein
VGDGGSADRFYVCGIDIKNNPFHYLSEVKLKKELGEEETVYLFS